MAGILESIVALEHTLNELRRAQASLDGIPDWMAELHEEHSRHRREIDEVQAAAEEAGQERRRAEGDLGEAQERLRKFQEQIGRVTTQREYGAVLKEIDTVKTEIAELEKVALGAMERLDEGQGKLGEMEEAFRDLDSRYRAELERWEKEKPGVARTVEELSKKATGLKTHVARPYLVLLERLIARYDGEATATIRRVAGSRGPNSLWHCAACSYSVRPQIVVDIRNGGLHQCDACKRILYHDETAAAAG